MKPPTAVFTRVFETGNPDAQLAHEYANEMWLLAARLEDLLEEVAPEQLQGLRVSLWGTAQGCDRRVPFWSVNSWTPPSKEAA